MFLNHIGYYLSGGGSSGCALMANLSEDYSVLLLEAGGAPSIMQRAGISL
jgi:choline dehydrogenase-like flavoprotein